MDEIAPWAFAVTEIERYTILATKPSGVADFGHKTIGCIVPSFGHLPNKEGLM